MAENDLVSVLIPAYNHEKYIRQALESVINQTYGPIELLVTDDGSTDGTWAIIQEMESACRDRFQRTVFKRQENQGICQSLKGMQAEAQGCYITLMASDDLMDPGLVAESFSFLENNPAYGAVFFNSALIDGDGQTIYWDENREPVYEQAGAVYMTMGDWLSSSRPDVDYQSPDFGNYRSLMKGNYIHSPPFYRTSLLKDTGFYTSEAPLEDWYFLLQLAKHCKMKFFDQPMWHYRWHSSNTVKQAEKMYRMALATWIYEVKQVIAAKDKKSLEDLHQLYRRYKPIAGNDKLKLYKTRSVDGKRIVLKILAAEISFRYCRDLQVFI